MELNVDEINKILVVKNRALGDSVIGLGALSYLRSIFPDSDITYANPGWITNLYQEVSIDADRVVKLNFKRPIDWIENLIYLSVNRFDLIVELHQSGRSGLFFKYFSKIFRIPYIYHNHNLKDGVDVVDQGVTKPSVQRDLDGVWSGLRQLGLVGLQNPSYLDFPPSIKVVNFLQQKRVILGVVATRRTKMWSIDNYSKLAQIFIERGFEVVIPLSKSKIDMEIKDEISVRQFNSRVKIVQLELSKLPQLMAESTFYIGNDTGLKHIMAAVGRPTYTFFGPEEPLEWHPYDQNKHKYFYIKSLECRTAKSHYCGLDLCVDHQCLNGITVEQVVSQLESDLIL